MFSKNKVDKPLLVTILILLFFGLVIFSSAALGVLSSNEVKFYSVIETQLVYALIGGLAVLFFGSIIPFNFYKKYAYHIFGFALFLTVLVFIPGLSIFHGGAHRWISIGPLTLQPSEALKFGFVIFMAMWSATYRKLFKDFRFGLVPFILSSVIISLIMLKQPDLGTLLVILFSGFAVYFSGGARMRHLLTIFGIGTFALVSIILLSPYRMERVMTFFDSSRDLKGSSWQLNQSLIAVGSGGVFGRGLGQGVQKFNYLPEPIGDSIFAVASEELGLLGALIIIILYGIVIYRGVFIANNTEDQFGRLLAVGIVSIIFAQATINISSMIGIFPLTGVPLPLISHGGTALMVSLFELGVLLNISKSLNI